MRSEGLIKMGTLITGIFSFGKLMDLLSVLKERSVLLSVSIIYSVALTLKGKLSDGLHAPGCKLSICCK